MTPPFFSSICKIKDDGTFESVTNTKNNLDSMLDLDRKYGYMQNSGIITYSVENNDKEITVMETEKAFYKASYEWSIDTPIHFINIREFRKTHPQAQPMIRVIFKDESEDDNLDGNTIAYMGYPLNGNTFYGILVLNKRYHFTIDGEPISGNELKKLGIKVQYEDDVPRYSTMDLDKIFRHELGHGVFGLPHSQNSNVTMSSNEGRMAEHNTEEDITRAQYKAGNSNIPNKWKLIVRNFLHRWSEHY